MDAPNAPPSTARPEGCWCKGLGGRGGEAPVCVPVDVGGTLWHFSDEPTRILIDPEARPVWLECCPYCPEGKQASAYKALITAELYALADRWLDRVWKHCGIPAEFQRFRLETSPFLADKPVLRDRLSESAIDWWYFWGKYGAGKTALAVSLMWTWLHRERKDLRFVTSPELLADIRRAYDDSAKGVYTEEAIVGRYMVIPLLVLDDLGSERLSGNGWAEGKLSEILTYRHAHGLATVITSNYSLDAISERLGEQGDRIASRIYERCGKTLRVIEVTGPNLRLV